MNSPIIFKDKDGDINVTDLSLMDMFHIPFKENNNMILGHNTNDCAIRAISYVSGMDWEEAYKDLYNYASKFYKGQLYNEREVLGGYITCKLGFGINIVEYYLPVYDFILNNSKGLYIVIIKGGPYTDHMFVVDNGVYVDDRKSHAIDEILITPISVIYYKV